MFCVSSCLRLTTFILFVVLWCDILEIHIIYYTLLISAVSWRTWSLAVKAMALLVQPTVRVPPQAPNLP